MARSNVAITAETAKTLWPDTVRSHIEIGQYMQYTQIFGYCVKPMQTRVRTATGQLLV
jgi:hypothetical protein